MGFNVRCKMKIPRQKHADHNNSDSEINHKGSIFLDKLFVSAKYIKIKHHQTAKKTAAEYRAIIRRRHIKTSFLELSYVPLISPVNVQSLEYHFQTPHIEKVYWKIKDLSALR